MRGKALKEELDSLGNLRGNERNHTTHACMLNETTADIAADPRVLAIVLSNSQQDSE